MNSADSGGTTPRGPRNEEVAALLREYAELTVITGGDVFRVRNYEKAARSIHGWPQDVGQLDLKALRAIPGVGASIAARIAEFSQTGSIRALDELRARIPLSQRCTYTGSLRRWRETIGDIDILAAAGDPGPLMAAFAAGHDVVASGPTKTTVRTASGLTADLRVVPLDVWGAALQYFTGSAAHNVAIRQVAIRQKLKLSEYGLFDADTGQLIVSHTEEEVCAQLGLD